MHKLALVVASGLLLCVSNARADDEPKPRLASARVVSYESVETLSRKVCGLVAIADVDGHSRLFDVSVDGKRCSSADAPNAVPLRVRIQSRPDGWRDVDFEADGIEGVGSSDVQASVNGTARELLAELDKPLPVAPVTRVAPIAPSSTASTSPGQHTRGGGIALVSVGGAGLGIAAIIGLVALLDSAGHAFGCGVAAIGGGSCGNRDFSGYGIAAGVAGGLGLAFLVTGVIVLSSATPDKPGVSAQIGPTGGSFRVTF